jgi:hypothetical protein
MDPFQLSIPIELKNEIFFKKAYSVTFWERKQKFDYTFLGIIKLQLVDVWKNQTVVTLFWW